MRKLILIVHTSLDGYIASENGEFDNFKPSPENLDFVNSVTEEADAALMGRVSFQLLESGWPDARNRPGASNSEIKYSNWYNDAQRIVISTTLPESNSPNIKVINRNIADEVKAIKSQSGKNILMFGSPTIFKLLTDLNLIDEYWVILYPAIFGKGIQLFRGGSNAGTLTLLKTTQLSNGEIAINYKVNK